MIQPVPILTFYPILVISLLIKSNFSVSIIWEITMNPYNLDISGDWHADPAVLDKFSRDMSAYRILPALVVEPINEEELISTLQFARNEGLGIVSRSVYLKMELGPAYAYLREIKELFDPEYLLNPGALFDTDPLCTHMDFSPMLQR
jgi:hypothetical protein